jgi:hypothetical protein
MSLQFIIPTPLQKNNQRTLAKGFGLPLVQRAVIATKVATEQSDKKESISIFGTPVYGTVFFAQPNYDVSSFNPDTREYVTTNFSTQLGENTNGGFIIENCIIDVSQTKNIVKTDVVDFTGSIKEYISESDYTITIRGFLSTQSPDLYPTEEVGILVNYLKAPVALSITSTFLNTQFGINNVVVESYTMSQQQGLRNVQYFQINCSSDFNFEILETDV